jgi:hypothetical protein
MPDAYVTKFVQVVAVTVKRGPWVFLESRTWIAAGVVATSTQSFGLLVSL